MYKICTHLAASQLVLTRGERVVRIRRVRLADGFPLSFDETYLPLELLERKCDVPMIEAEYKLDAVAAENDVASALQVKPRSPIFHIQRTSYSTCSRPVDYETLYYRGDLVRFVTRLVRNTSR